MSDRIGGPNCGRQVKRQQGIAASTIPYFVQNEFIDDDVNKWTTLARERASVRTLVEATDGHPDTSARFRDIFRPLGLGDELRAIVRVGGGCWGYMCVHREAGARFSKEEVRFIERIAPHVGEGFAPAISSRASARLHLRTSTHRRDGAGAW